MVSGCFLIGSSRVLSSTSGILCIMLDYYIISSSSILIIPSEFLFPNVRYIFFLWLSALRPKRHQPNTTLIQNYKKYKGSYRATKLQLVSHKHSVTYRR